MGITRFSNGVIKSFNEFIEGGADAPVPDEPSNDDNNRIEEEIMALLGKVKGRFTRQHLDKAYELVKHVPSYAGDPGKWQRDNDQIVLLVKLLDTPGVKNHKFTRWMIENTKSFGEAKRGNTDAYYILDYAIFSELDTDMLNDITLRTLEQGSVRPYQYNYGNVAARFFRIKYGCEFVAEKYASHHQQFCEFLSTHEDIDNSLIDQGINMEFWDHYSQPYEYVLYNVEKARDEIAAPSPVHGFNNGAHGHHDDKSRDDGKDEFNTRARYTRLDPENAPSLDEYRQTHVLQKDLHDMAIGLLARLKFNAAGMRSGGKVENGRDNLMISGPPGTGKTEWAGILGRFYRDSGRLSQGHVIKTRASALIGNYVGNSGQHVRDMAKEAMGGVLFIDEIYHFKENDTVYSKEAVSELLTIMEDHKDDLIVIVAGYEEENQEFLKLNDGLKRRFREPLRVDHFTRNELSHILSLNLERQGLTLEEGAEDVFLDLLKSEKDKDPKRFGNAGDVEKLLQDVIEQHARRIYVSECGTEVGTADVDEHIRTHITREAVLDVAAKRKGTQHTPEAPGQYL